MVDDESMTNSQCVLFQNESRNVVLMDVPRSVEEAQLSCSERLTKLDRPRRLLSMKPPDEPYKTPEPKNGNGVLADSVSDLMSAAAATNALEILRKEYQGPWCLPRTMSSSGQDVEPSQKRKRNEPTRQDSSDSSATLVRPNNSEDILIPQKCYFLEGTISSERKRFVEEAPQFDLIILDPPWPNRSARRKKHNYNVADSLEDIRRILSLVPVKAHLAPHGLVAVWVTNRASVIELMTSAKGVFAEWGLELVDEWTWLKVTTAGEPIFDINSAWRKPWERVLIARKRGSETKLPGRGKVIVSVPDLHSRKPNLGGLFGEFLPENFIGLEVFARNLTAGWWCWGDEVLKFQAPEHWSNS